MTIATRKDDAAETIVEAAETTENAALGTDTNDEGVMTAEDLAALCESRSETYSFLARLFPVHVAADDCRTRPDGAPLGHRHRLAWKDLWLGTTQHAAVAVGI